MNFQKHILWKYLEVFDRNAQSDLEMYFEQWMRLGKRRKSNQDQSGEFAELAEKAKDFLKNLSVKTAMPGVDIGCSSSPSSLISFASYFSSGLQMSMKLEALYSFV